MIVSFPANTVFAAAVLSLLRAQATSDVTGSALPSILMTKAPFRVSSYSVMVPPVG